MSHKPSEEEVAAVALTAVTLAETSLLFAKAMEEFGIAVARLVSPEAIEWAHKYSLPDPVLPEKDSD